VLEASEAKDTSVGNPRAQHPERLADRFSANRITDDDNAANKEFLSR
jgi:hypothetical protein